MGFGVENNHCYRIRRDILGDWSNFYNHRNMLRVRESEVSDGPQLSIMTYNVFALCGRGRYRDSDGQSMIHLRYTVLAHEIGRYNPDIICLQEIDRRNKIVRLQKILQMLGYEIFFSYHNSSNTMAICYKTDLFYDAFCEKKYYSELLATSSEGYNNDCHCVLLLGLRFKEELLEGHQKPSKECLIIANTHLQVGNFWKKKTRQTAALLKRIKEFSESYSRSPGLSECYTFLAGDFNSTPKTPVYLSLVTRPLQLNGLIECNPQELSELEESHDSLGIRAISLYSIGYHLVNPRNSGIDNDRNEPPFSFWGPNWEGLCDYIFIVCDWSGDDRTEVDTLEEFTEATSCKLLALLRMPRSEEMEGALPIFGSYPSDHLCMMADIELI